MLMLLVVLNELSLRRPVRAWLLTAAAAAAAPMLLLAPVDADGSV